MSVTLRVLRLPHGEGLPLPSYQSANAAGLDLVAAIPEDAPVSLESSDRALVPTGLAFELPEGYEAQVRPRSGLALKHGVTVLNSPGTIDADYRGEVMVILINLGAVPVSDRARRPHRPARRLARHPCRGDGGCRTRRHRARRRRLRLHRILGQRVRVIPPPRGRSARHWRAGWGWLVPHASPHPARRGPVRAEPPSPSRGGMVQAAKARLHG